MQRDESRGLLSLGGDVDAWPTGQSLLSTEFAVAAMTRGWLSSVQFQLRRSLQRSCQGRTEISDMRLSPRLFERSRESKISTG